MAENSSSVASVAIVVIIFLALIGFYFIFNQGVSADREIDIDLKTPPIEEPFDSR